MFAELRLNAIGASMTNHKGPDENHTRPRLEGLDGLRGLAILLVMVFHLVLEYPFSAGVDSLYYRLGGMGWFGVDLFFVLSGFLITGILIDHKGGENYFINFFGRRALRIFPLYYTVLIFLFLLMPLFGAYDTPELRFIQSHQAFFWTFMANWGFVAAGSAHVFNVEWLALVHFWSLAVEEQFYLAWPFIVAYFSRSWFVRICLFLIGCAFGFRLMIAVFDLPQGAAYTLTPARIDTLAVGALIAVAVRHTAETRRLLYAFAPWGAGLAACIMIFIFVTQNGIWFADRITSTIGFSALAVGWGCFLVMCLPEYPRPFVRGLMASSVLRRFGLYSYGLYVLHHLILPHLQTEPFAELPLAEPVAATVYIAVCIAIFFAAAWMSWHLLEKRFIALKWIFNYSGERAKDVGRRGARVTPVGKEVA